MDDLNQVFSFPSLKFGFFFEIIPIQYCRIPGLDLPTSSVIAGMRGAKADARRGGAPLVLYRLELEYYYIYVLHRILCSIVATAIIPRILGPDNTQYGSRIIYRTFVVYPN